MAGYSGTPLSKKLGIKAGGRVATIGAPSQYRSLLAPLPAGVTFVPRISATTDLVHLFTTKRAELERGLRSVLKTLRPDATVWVSWPKKTANVPTDITED